MRASDIITWGLVLDDIDSKVDQLEAMASRSMDADRAGLLKTVKLLRRQVRQSRQKIQ